MTHDTQSVKRLAGYTPFSFRSDGRGWMVVVSWQRKLVDNKYQSGVQHSRVEYRDRDLRWRDACADRAPWRQKRYIWHPSVSQLLPLSPRLVHIYGMDGSGFLLSSLLERSLCCIGHRISACGLSRAIVSISQQPASIPTVDMNKANNTRFPGVCHVYKLTISAQRLHNFELHDRRSLRYSSDALNYLILYNCARCSWEWPVRISRFKQFHDYTGRSSRCRWDARSSQLS